MPAEPADAPPRGPQPRPPPLTVVCGHPPAARFGAFASGPPPPAPADLPLSNSSELFSPEVAGQIAAELAATGPLTIAQVREYIRSNTVKAGRAGGGCVVDPELMVAIDARAGYPVFVVGDAVYTRDELCAAYPFAAFGVAPEHVFARQEVGEFAAAGEPEYVARDEGDPSPFATARGMIQLAAGGAPPAPTRVVLTDIYLAKERWDSFVLTQQVVTGMRTYLPAALAGGGLGDMGLALGGGGAGRLALRSAADLDRREAELDAREAAADARDRAAAQDAREARLAARERAAPGAE